MIYTQEEKLYDEVHAIMGKEFITYFKNQVRSFESEFAYNHYGTRGSVDFVSFENMTSLGYYPILTMYELESGIPRLEELIRKLKGRLEFFPPYFEDTRGVKNLARVNLNLILLATRENLEIVQRFSPNLVAAFSYPIRPQDIFNKPKDPGEPDFSFWRGKEVSVAFFDPLKVRTLENNVGFFISEQMLSYHRAMAFHLLSLSSLDAPLLQVRLSRLKPRYSNSREFLQAYREYVNK